LSILIQLSIILISIAFGFFLEKNINSFESRFEILEEVIDLIDLHGYFNFPEDRVLEYGMIRGVIQAYNDPYTSFLEPPQNELQTDQLEGRYGGIGARIEKDVSGNFLLFPFPDSPSKKAGILDGDVLIKIDEISVNSDLAVDEVISAIRGPIGDIVRITVSRPPETEEYSFEIVRTEINLPSITWNIVPDYDKLGYIQINIIADTTPGEVEHAVADLISQGAEYLILDLRNNGGGLVQAGVDTAGLFLPQGEILAQEYKNKPVETLGTDHDGPYLDIPLVLLVNNNTASASEIIAGSLQSVKRAYLIGTQTYGKDTIQLVFNLSDGSSLHVTSARWWIPNYGKSDDEWLGLSPDLEVTEEEVTQTLILFQYAADYFHLPHRGE